MLNNISYVSKIDWNKTNNIVPVIIQDSLSYQVLMHGYMNQESLLQTEKERLVTFYSRTKKRLWTKGETSGNFLRVVSINIDCDKDTLLILVEAIGKTCHLNKNSCFALMDPHLNFFYQLEKTIEDKKIANIDSSYTASLYHSGTARIAQKVGEEAIETILAVMKKNVNEFINESSDLIYHLLVLLHDQNLNFNLIIENLKQRQIKK